MQVQKVINKILVTTDFSEESKAAFDMAADFAHKSGAAITLMTVVEVPGFVPYGNLAGVVGVLDGLHAELKAAATTRLKEWGTTTSAFAGLKVGAEVRQGVAYREIVQAAKDLDIDLIVIATHGHSGISGFLIGSVGEKVVRLAPCPVLTVKAKV